MGNSSFQRYVVERRYHPRTVPGISNRDSWQGILSSSTLSATGYRLWDQGPGTEPPSYIQYNSIVSDRIRKEQRGLHVYLLLPRRDQDYVSRAKVLYIMNEKPSTVTQLRESKFAVRKSKVFFFSDIIAHVEMDVFGFGFNRLRLVLILKDPFGAWLIRGVTTCSSLARVFYLLLSFPHPVTFVSFRFISLQNHKHIVE
ncbi:hypothetical protein M501DRAFT_151245 [Patellaria atrata CBS 101060]|uniref:Uncharacterized protein n=1 Tax=Patellaria atrata CBS 101060 TaxID=1346257 RepID=A0A9P4SA40_9PEZI|nr:hypothetical protein M501DRAFT_151245 [Patellaria atrata CBS 101060]